MKKNTFIFLLGILLSAITFTSCDKLEDAVEITINTEFKTHIEATPVEGKSTTFKESVDFNPKDCEDLADYIDDIKSVDLLSIKIEVTSIQPEGIELESGSFSVKDNENGSLFVYNTPDNTKLAVGTVFEIGEGYKDWDVIKKMINDLHASTITAVGSVNNDEFKIGFEMTHKVKATATAAK